MNIEVMGGRQEGRLQGQLVQAQVCQDFFRAGKDPGDHLVQRPNLAARQSHGWWEWGLNTDAQAPPATSVTLDVYFLFFL